MSPAEVRALIASRKRLAVAIQALEQKSGDYLVDLYSDLLNDLLATIGTMTSPAGKAVNLDRSIRIERRLMVALQEYRPRFAGLFEAQFTAGIRTVEDIDLTTFETLREALFQELRAGMEAFRTEGAAALQSAARTRWIQAVDGTSTNLVAKLRGEIATGMVSGSSQEQIAQRIAALPEFRHDTLPPLKATPERVFGGRLGTNQALENRARRIARRELAWTANRAHEAWTSEAWPSGRYKNVNPLDDNTTDLCERASEQPPMPLEEWDASEFGRAPRGDHVDHCRSLLVLVQETAIPRTKPTGS